MMRSLPHDYMSIFHCFSFGNRSVQCVCVLSAVKQMLVRGEMLTLLVDCMGKCVVSANGRDLIMVVLQELNANTAFHGT